MNLNIAAIRQFFKEKFEGTGIIWFFILVLMSISILEIYSISGANTFAQKGNSTTLFFFDRIKHVLVSVVIIVSLQLFPTYRYLRDERWLRLLYIGALMVQVGMIFFGADHSVGGEANRSIFGIQPTEFATIITLIYSVFLFQKNQKIIKDINYLPMQHIFDYLKAKFNTLVLKRELDKEDRKKILERKRAAYIYVHYAIPMVAPMFLLFLSIVLGNHLSSGIMLALVWVVTAFVAGLPFWRHVKVVVIAGVVGLSLIYALEGIGRTGTWTSRIDGYVVNLFGRMPNVNSRDYELTQVNKAEIAIALGMKPAVLNGGSLQRSLLEQSYTDYIFAIIVERYSVIGVIALFALYTGLYYRFRGVARKLKSNYDAMVIYTLGFYILFQMVIHVYVSTGLSPSTGLTLPFISKGGSSLMAMSVAVGIILSYNRAEKMHPEKGVEPDAFIEESIRATDEKLQERAEESLEADLRAIEEIEKSEDYEQA